MKRLGSVGDRVWARVGDSDMSDERIPTPWLPLLAHLSLAAFLTALAYVLVVEVTYSLGTW